MQDTVGTPKSAAVHPGAGFRIRTRFPRPAPESVRALAEYDTPSISDLMNRLYAVEIGIQQLTDPRLSIAGPACTVKVYPGDNLMVHKSLDVARPGDVVVVDTSGSHMTAVLGDLISTKARHRGIAGFVVDGLVRDVDAIRALADFPVFARGITPIGPLHRGPGEIGYPVCLGGVVVHAGDIVIGDANGVVVVPRETADDVVERLRRQQRSLAAYTAAVARGEFSNAWVDDALAAAGVEIDDTEP